MLHFAYDGSIHGDWVFRYALQLARHAPGRRLHLVHVWDGQFSRRVVEQRLAHIGEECAEADVELEVSTASAPPNLVARRVLALVPPGPDGVLLCGTRRQPRHLGYLSGTVAAEIFAGARTPVAAIRVVLPGLLGAPRNLLLPLRGDLGVVGAAAPVLRLFGPGVDRAHVLLVKAMGRVQFHHLSLERAEQLLAEGYREVEGLEAKVRETLASDPVRIDTIVVVSDDVPKEILVHANRTQAQMVLLGASDRSVSERFLYGDPVEQVLRDAPCDIAVYRGLA